MKNLLNIKYAITGIILLFLLTSMMLVEPIKNVSLYPSGAAKEFIVKDDSSEFTLYQVHDTAGLPLYYYREVLAYPCRTDGVCQIMKLRIYWDMFGNYLQYELPEDENLTKINHKDFSEKDYQKLHRILNNPESGMKVCKFEKLTSREAENKYHAVDGCTGATVSDLDFEYVQGAVKTTYSLWHFVNSKTQDTIKGLSATFYKGDDSVSWSDYVNAPKESKLEVLYSLCKSYELKNQNEASQVVDILGTVSDAEFLMLMELLRNSAHLPKSLQQAMLSKLPAYTYLRAVTVYNFLLMSDTKGLNKKSVISFRNEYSRE